MTLSELLERKRHAYDDLGFEPSFIPSDAFDFQRALITWAVKKGRSSIFADCGLGKSLMQLTFAENVVRQCAKPVLVMTPLAVAPQMVEEAAKFGIEACRSNDGKFPSGSRVVVTNYERLHHFDPNDFVGAVCDESSILKNCDGIIKAQVTDFMRKTPYRLLATATAAPNDFVELGTSSEALGYLGHMDMLNRFFKNDLNNSATGRAYGAVVKWRLKGHAELPFWRWVASWARACRKPSDLGFDDSRFVLPNLVEEEHLVEVATLADGMLFALPAVGLKEQRDERRRSLADRCERVASLVNGTGEPAIVWCQLNDEADLAERLIPDARQVSGSMSDDAKESTFLDFAEGRLRVLITKPSIGAWGLNFQHCNHMTFFPSHSFEQYYQGVRRCWRFGQSRAVKVDIVTTEGEAGVLNNLKYKAAQADQMFSNLVAQMNRASGISREASFTTKTEIPKWLCANN